MGDAMKHPPNVEHGLAELENAALIGNADGEVRGRKVLAAAGITDRQTAARRRARAAEETAQESTEERAPATKSGDSKVTGRASKADKLSSTEQAKPDEKA